MPRLAVAASAFRQEIMATSTGQSSFKVHIKINHVEFATLLSESGLGISYEDQNIKNLISGQLRTLDIGIELEKGLISLLEDVRLTMSVVQEKTLPDRRDLYELSKEVRKVADDVRSLVFSVREDSRGGRLPTAGHHKQAVRLLDHVKKTQTDLRALRKSLRPANEQGSNIPKERGEMTEAWRRAIQVFCGRRSGVQKCEKTVATGSKDKDIPRSLQTTITPIANPGHASASPPLTASACRFASIQGMPPSYGVQSQTFGWVRESWGLPGPAIVTLSHVLDPRTRGQRGL